MEKVYDEKDKNENDDDYYVRYKDLPSGVLDTKSNVFPKRGTTGGP